MSHLGLSFVAEVQMLDMLGMFIDLLALVCAVLSGLVVPMSDVRTVWFNLFVTYFMVLSDISH